jgi:hypothetical protein
MKIVKKKHILFKKSHNKRVRHDKLLAVRGVLRKARQIGTSSAY